MIIKTVRDFFKETFKEFPKIEPPPRGKWGDMATNLAFVLASAKKEKPVKMAEEIASILSSAEFIEEARVVPPGFVNFKYSKDFIVSQFYSMLENPDFFKKGFGKKRVHIDFVSANPTGPLHVGHGRAAALGDSLARILEFVGYEVLREYYNNDTGRQIRLLAESVKARGAEILGVEYAFPEEGYRGDYIYDIARDIIKKLKIEEPSQWLELKLEKIEQEAVAIIMRGIKNTLERFRVKFDSFFSEKTLHPDGITGAIQRLRDYVYEKDGALWFRSSQFGDEKDRVLIRSDGTPTYFAADIAYHLTKIERGFDILINIWGADHHGYVKRMKGALKALGFSVENAKFLIYQLVRLTRAGEPISMSTRAGEFIPLDQVLDEVGVDAARFIYLTKTYDSHLDFDLELAKQQNENNPVFYVQYAHARICSLFENARKKGLNLKIPSNLELFGEEERPLILKTLLFEKALEDTISSFDPQAIVNYLVELASLFHNYYHKFVFVDPKNPEISACRLTVAKGVGMIIKEGLELLGVSAPAKM